MSNKNFSKKGLIIALGALAGGIGALSSMTVPTSAMERKKEGVEEIAYRQNNEKIVIDFKEQYNAFWKRLDSKTQEDKKSNALKYSVWICKEAAEILADSAVGNGTKNQLTIDLTDLCGQLVQQNRISDAKQVSMLMNTLDRAQGINWYRNS